MVADSHFGFGPLTEFAHILATGTQAIFLFYFLFNLHRWQIHWENNSDLNSHGTAGDDPTIQLIVQYKDGTTKWGCWTWQLHMEKYCIIFFMLLHLHYIYTWHKGLIFHPPVPCTRVSEWLIRPPVRQDKWVWISTCPAIKVTYVKYRRSLKSKSIHFSILNVRELPCKDVVTGIYVISSEL